MPKISVIIPVYNAEKYLTLTIDCILKQTFNDFELILVDDGSTDLSGKICDDYQKRDNRVKVIHKENAGICEARNTGLEIAKGEYIMFSDNDDVMEELTLEENFSLIKKFDADVVKFGRNSLYIKDEKVYRKDVIKYNFKLYEKDEINKEFIDLIYDKIFVCVWDGIYKKEVISKFNSKYKKGGEDIEFNLDFLKKINKLILSDKVYYNHCIRDSFSTSTKFNENKLEDTKRLLNNYTEIVQQFYIKDNEKYNLILIRDYLNPILMNFNNKKCSLNFWEKIKAIKELHFIFRKANLFKEFKLSYKYTIELIIFKLNIFSLLLIISKFKKS